MAKPNYAFEKRQKDLAKKQKKEEKRLKKAASGSSPETPEVMNDDLTEEVSDQPAAEDPSAV